MRSRSRKPPAAAAQNLVFSFFFMPAYASIHDATLMAARSMTTTSRTAAAQNGCMSALAIGMLERPTASRSALEVSPRPATRREKSSRNLIPKFKSSAGLNDGPSTNNLCDPKRKGLCALLLRTSFSLRFTPACASIRGASINGCPLDDDNQQNCHCPKWFYVSPRGAAPYRKSAGIGSFTEACDEARRILKGFDPIDPEIQELRKLKHDGSSIGVEDAIERYLTMLASRDRAANYLVCVAGMFKTTASAPSRSRTRPHRFECQPARLFGWYKSNRSHAGY